MGNTVKGINTGYRRIESSRQQLLNAQRATLFQSKRMLLDLHEYATQRQAKRLEKETTAAISAVSKATTSDRLLSKVALRKIERQTKSLSEGFDATYLKKKMAQLEGKPRRKSLTGIETSLAKQEKAAVQATKQLIKELKNKLLLDENNVKSKLDLVFDCTISKVCED